MSIYGSLKAGVTGLKAQASSMAMISDNIANANTVGYKRSVADFETLVTRSGSTGSYAPGGVRANSVALIDQQGLINASASTTDIAIAGRGFFAVSTAVSPNGSVPTGTERLYTRAGSFKTNSEGFLTSSSGEYLLGVPADAAGNIPTATLPVDQLKAINVGSITGSAKATATVSIGANLPATSAPPTNAYTVTLGATSAVPFPSTADVLFGPVVVTDPAVDPTGTPLNYNATIRFRDAGANGAAGTVGNGYNVELELNTTPTATIVQLGYVSAAGTLDFNATVAGSSTTAPFTGNTGGQLSFKIKGSFAAAAVAVNPVPASVLDSQYAVRMAGPTGTPSTSTGAALDLATGTGASGVQSGYTSDVTLYDSLGVGHNIQLAYIKTATNTWDVYVTKMTMIGRTDPSGNPVDSITGTTQNSWVYDGNAVAAGADLATAAQAVPGRLRPTSRLGSLAFNENGSIKGFTANADARLNSSVATSGVNLSSPTSTGAALLNPVINFGTVGTKNGVTQQSDAFATSFINQDGVRFGYKTGVAVDKDGIVRAVFDNGQRLPVARVAITTFADPNRLDARSGNLYAQTDASGSPTTNFSGIGGAGQVQSNALENSTVDLAEEFTDMIVTQRNYSANSRTITTSDEMLQEIINLKR